MRKAVILCCFICACGRTATSGTQAEGSETIAIEPPSIEVVPGQAFFLKVVDSKSGANLLGDDALVLTTSDPQVIHIDADGSGIGLNSGGATIQAAYRGFVAKATAIVRGARMVRVDVAPRVIALDVGDVASLTVTGVLAEGGPIDVTEAGTRYTSSNPSAVSVDAEGHIVAIAPIAHASITVENAELTDSIAVQIRAR